MARRIILLALCTFAVMQYSAAFPTVPGAGPVTTKYLDEYMKVITRTIENGRKVFVNVKEELSAKHGKSEDLRILGTYAEEILNDIKDLKKMNDDDIAKVKNSTRVFVKIVNLSVPTFGEPLKVLNENSMDVLHEILILDCTDFVKNFTEDVQNYINGLTNSQKQKESALIDWFNYYKQPIEVVEKFLMFKGSFLENFSYV